ncbi:MAG: nucleotide pyrophosphohydrolase [Rugosibacter sp.]|jgi:dCTP diphosphatase|nr:nucleotide pyrophosphohydrolase [Rugosibacter sp.]MDO9273732.1 nucleotide pyrophosphohydrolase [Rugosibacter sp.]
MTKASDIHDLTSLRDALRIFCTARQWQPFHTPKNLSMALIKEAAEIVEHFQWATAEESHALDPEKKSAVADEIADVLMYLVQLADVLDIDPLAAAQEKIVKNAKKYPALKPSPENRS